MTDRPPSRFDVTVAPGQAGERLDRVLAGALPDLSRTRIQALLRAGKVRLAGRVVEDAAFRLAGGEQLVLEVPPPAPAVPVPQPIPLSVVFEDDELIVIDKPAGLVVHPAAGHAAGTLVNALLAHCGASLSGIGGVERPGIVHRLDKDTSGLIVVAKTDRAHRALAAQFADHGRTGGLSRVYQALVWGVPAASRITIRAPLARDPRHREKIAVVPEGRGRVAVTHVETRERFGPSARPWASLAACRLETGRTHQIRVHLTHAGHPLLGDPVYGAGYASKAGLLPDAAAEALRDLGRQALHAAHLGFVHPVSGRAMAFDSPPPPDFQRLAAALREETSFHPPR